ncbi:MAG: hypothetical protein ABIP53_08135 [Candidatus Limnocylindrales bacterium]
MSQRTLASLVELESDASGLGLGVRGAGNGAVVGHHVLAERDPSRHLALVDREVGVHLWPSWVTRDVHPVGDAEASVRAELPVLDLDSNRLEAEAGERVGPPHREQDLVALGRRSIGELDDVGAVSASPGLDAGRTHVGPDIDAVPSECGLECVRAARMIPGVDPIVRRHEDRRHAIAGVDLGQLDPGRPGAEDDKAARQLTGRRRFAVRPRRDAIEPRDVVRDRRVAPDRDQDGLCLEPSVAGRCADDHPAGAREPPLTANDRRPSRFKVGDVAAVVGPVVRSLADDHPVAKVRGSRPGVVAPDGMDRCRVEECLRRHAGPVRAGATEQLAVDDRHARAVLPGEVGGRLTSLTRADDDQIESLAHRRHSAQQDSLETSFEKACAPILSASAIVG